MRRKLCSIIGSDVEKIAPSGGELMADKAVVIIGAGPAGLTAAFELSKFNIKGTILEADSSVGGISRTEERDGYRFDIGGHRFFSKSKEITNLWAEMLPKSMVVRPRLSRIYYGGKLYDYPLKPTNALGNMGLLTALSCFGSYGMAKIRQIPNPKNFEEWVTNQFGHRLYSMFFKTYTEKVWGIPCREIDPPPILWTPYAALFAAISFS
jgi:protoporphyrinogen oxidase